jgi:hypothetical protein
MKNDQRLEEAIEKLIAVLNKDDPNFTLKDGSTVLSEIPETTGLTSHGSKGFFRTYGPVTTLSELRANFPNLEILPYMDSSVTRVAANSKFDIDLPDKTQFVVLYSSDLAIGSFGTKPNDSLIDGEKENGVFILSSSQQLKLYLPSANKISVRNLSTTPNYITVLSYQTGKMVTM